MNLTGEDHRYVDIIDMPHHISVKHPRMTIAERAAQFSPFAALTGYGDAVKEASRLTDERIELDESAKAILNTRLQIALEQVDQQPEVTITYFEPDKKKAGGAYVSITGVIKRVDTFTRTVIFQDNTVIPIDEIYAIEGEFFPD